MPGFLQDFLHVDFAAMSRKDAPRVFLAAFGKHPGWNDHIEDIGLDTAALINAKRYLYLQGLSGQIDTNAWEKLEPDARLEGFDHWLLWQRPGEVILGRLWSSSDGKGRTRYPMVLLAHLIGAPAGWLLNEGVPILEACSAKCRVVTTASEVQQTVASALADLRARLVANPEGSSNLSQFSESVTAAPWADSGRQRIFHVLINEFSSFAPGTVDTKSEYAAKARCMRVSRTGSDVTRNLAHWTAFVLTQLDLLVPTLVIVPVDSSWVDVVVGEPAGAEFFCLRATPKSLPAAYEIPYQVTPTLAETVDRAYDLSNGSTLPARSVFSQKPTSETVRSLLTTRDGIWAVDSGGGLLKKFIGFLGR